MFKYWKTTDNLKDDTFSSDSRRLNYYTTIEGPEIRDYVNKTDLARPMQNLYEDIKHFHNWTDRGFYLAGGPNNGVFRKSIPVSGDTKKVFSFNSDTVVSIKLNPGTGDVYKFYLRLSPGVAFNNGTMAVVNPQRFIAERQISKILTLDDWKDEGVNINYFYEADIFQAKVTQRNTQGIPIPYYFCGRHNCADSVAWGDSRYGYKSGLQMIQAIYQADTLTFRSQFRAALGDSIAKITLEPTYRILPSSFAGDTFWWKISASGNIYADTRPAYNNELNLWVTRASVADVNNPATLISKADSRIYIQNFQDFNQFIFLNTPQAFGDTTTLNWSSNYSSTNPWGDSNKINYTRITNADELIVFLRQASSLSISNSSIFGWKETTIPKVTPAHSKRFWANKDLVVSRYAGDSRGLTYADTLGKSWASVMEMSGDSWTFYGNKVINKGGLHPYYPTDQALGSLTNRWKVFGDSGNFIRNIVSPKYFGDSFIATTTVKSSKIVGDSLIANNILKTNNLLASGNMTVVGLISGDSLYATRSLFVGTTSHLVGAVACDTSINNAVWNDFADIIEVDSDSPIEYGKVYIVNKNKKHRLSSKYCEKGCIGISTDTYGISTGDKGTDKQIPIAVAGFALAHVDKKYTSGTPLTSSKNGILTKMNLISKIIHPERLLGTFYKEEARKIIKMGQRQVVINHRYWVKIK